MTYGESSIQEVSELCQEAILGIHGQSSRCWCRGQSFLNEGLVVETLEAEHIVLTDHNWQL